MNDWKLGHSVSKLHHSSIRFRSVLWNGSFGLWETQTAEYIQSDERINNPQILSLLFHLIEFPSPS